MAEYSYLVLYLPRGTSRDTARQILTDHAEYGNWELARMNLYADGSRKATGVTIHVDGPDAALIGIACWRAMIDAPRRARNWPSPGGPKAAIHRSPQPAVPRMPGRRPAHLGRGRPVCPAGRLRWRAGRRGGARGAAAAAGASHSPRGPPPAGARRPPRLAMARKHAPDSAPRRTVQPVGPGGAGTPSAGRAPARTVGGPDGQDVHDRPSRRCMLMSLLL
jgi:hypothetical protein